MEVDKSVIMKGTFRRARETSKMASRTYRFKVSGVTDYNKAREYWIARCKELKLTTYGDTRDGAKVRMHMALNLWVNTIGDNGLLPQRLRELKIPFDLDKKGNSLSSKKWTLEAVGMGV